MDTDEITVTDNKLRFSTPKMEQKLREHEAENLRRAEEKEEMLLNKPTPVLDAFANGVDKVKKLFAKKKAAKKKKALDAAQATKMSQRQH